MSAALVLAFSLSFPAQEAPPRFEAQPGWSLSFSGFRRVAAAGDLVVLSQTDGVYGNDAATGASRWARQDLAENFGVPTVAGASVYVGAAKGADSEATTEQATFALDLASGATRWKSAFWAYEGVVDAGERVVGVGTQACGGALAVVALRASDGEIAWSAPLDDLWKTAPRPHRAGDFVVCRGVESVAVLRASDGAVAWRTPSGEVWLECGARQDVVVLLGAQGDRQSVARGVSAAKGEVLWTAHLAAPATGLAFAGDDVLVATFAGEVARIELATGKERWRAKLANGSSADPVLAGELALVRNDKRGTAEKRSRGWSAVDLATGAVRGDVLEVEANDTLVADGRGRLLWSRPAAGTLQSLELRRVP